MANYPTVYASKKARPPKEELAQLFEKGFKSREVADRYGVKEATVTGWKTYYELTKPRSSEPKFKNQNLGIIPDEEFRPVVVRLGEDRFITDKYTVSQYGNVIGPKGIKLRWGNVSGYPHVMLSLDKDFFPDFTGALSSNKDSTRLKVTVQKKNVAIHKIVANTFLPRPIPEPFKKIWDTLTKDQKLCVQSGYVVDHIDGDKSNPHVSNLQYLTMWENSNHVKAYRGEDNGM